MVEVDTTTAWKACTKKKTKNHQRIADSSEFSEGLGGSSAEPFVFLGSSLRYNKRQFK